MVTSVHYFNTQENVLCDLKTRLKDKTNNAVILNLDQSLLDSYKVNDKKDKVNSWQYYQSNYKIRRVFFVAFSSVSEVFKVSHSLVFNCFLK